MNGSDEHQTPGAASKEAGQGRRSQRVYARHVELAETVLGALVVILLAIGGALLSYHYTEAGTEFLVTGALAVCLGLYVYVQYRYRGKQTLKWSPLVAAGTVGALLVGRAVWVWGHASTPPPFRAEVRAAAIHDATGPLGLFMVAYQSMYGPTISPVGYLLNLQVANLQDVASTIVSYSVDVGREPNGPWQKLAPIPLEETSLYAAGIVSAGSGRIGFPRGAYRLATPITREDLKHAALLAPSPTFNAQLANALAPHGTISGWAAFDSTTHEAGRVQDYFRVTLRDSANVTLSSVAKLYRCPDDREMDPQIGIILKLGPIVDISSFYVRYYGDPYPNPNR